MKPGECLHFRDLDMFHNVTRARPDDPSKTMHRSVLVLLARFQDDWWHGNMVKAYGTKGYTCLQGVGELETLFNLLDADGSGEVDHDEFCAGASQIVPHTDVEALFKSFDLDNDGRLTKKEFIAGVEEAPTAGVNHEDDHLW